jgi:hypothetical protein
MAPAVDGRTRVRSPMIGWRCIAMLMLPPTASAATNSALFGGFPGTMGGSDFPPLCIIGLRFWALPMRTGRADEPGRPAGGSPGSGTAPAVNESSGRGRGAPRCWCCRPARGPERRPLCRPRTPAPAVLWRIDSFPQTHQMMWYSKSLKSRKESVRPQFLSLRQFHLNEPALRWWSDPLKPRNSAISGGRLVTSLGPRGTPIVFSQAAVGALTEASADSCVLLSWLIIEGASDLPGTPTPVRSR